ncbi:MAG: hypothetical protein C0478_18055 [Planctomyces sp.]|nr:hypothetical protein [Planctomyces sp.]
MSGGWIKCRLWAVCAGLVLPVFAQVPAVAQDEDRSARFWSMMDRNGDGVLEGEEIPGMMRGRLEEAGIDLSRPVSRDDFNDVMSQMRRQREESGGGFGPPGGGGFGPPGGGGFGPPGGGGFGPPGGGFGGRGEGGGPPGGGFGGRGGDSGRGEGGRGGEDRGRGGDRGRGDSKSAKEVPKYDFSRELPEDYKPLDLDSDKQISFAEWPRSRRSEFASYDHNGDGFITPAEIKIPAFVTKTADDILGEALAARLMGNPFPPSGATLATTSSSSVSLGSAAPSEGRDRGRGDRGDRGGKGGPPSKDTPAADPILVEANGYFDRLDTNKNGVVDPDEWSVSKRLKPLFEKAGVDLSKPLNKEDFAAGYRKTKG